MKHCGINGNIHKWIANFLNQRGKCVVLEGKLSTWTHIDSGVPQGTVRVPLLFLLDINDLPKPVSSQVRLFADVCLLCKTIKLVQDQINFQKYLDKLQLWAYK